MRKRTGRIENFSSLVGCRNLAPPSVTFRDAAALRRLLLRFARFDSRLFRFGYPADCRDPGPETSGSIRNGLRNRFTPFRYFMGQGNLRKKENRFSSREFPIFTEFLRFKERRPGRILPLRKCDEPSQTATIPIFPRKIDRILPVNGRFISKKNDFLGRGVLAR